RLRAVRLRPRHGLCSDGRVHADEVRMDQRGRRPASLVPAVSIRPDAGPAAASAASPADEPAAVRDFVYNAQAARVVFGPGAIARLPEEIGRLGARRALVLSTPEQVADAERLARELGDHAVGVFARAVMHVPIETAREAREVAQALQADCAVAIGGGSTTGLGKAIALESGLPILAIPTTYAGSEMTSIYGITEAGVKKTGKDRKVLPKTVIYDVNLTLTLPAKIAGPSGMNAMAHLVEGLYAQDANPIISLLAVEGIRTLAVSL